MQGEWLQLELALAPPGFSPGMQPAMALDWGLPAHPTQAPV